MSIPEFTAIFLISFFDQFWSFKKRFKGSYFAYFAKIWPKNMHRSSTSRFFGFTVFFLVTWDDLDLWYDHKAQEIEVTNVRDTIHADSFIAFTCA